MRSFDRNLYHCFQLARLRAVTLTLLFGFCLSGCMAYSAHAGKSEIGYQLVESDPETSKKTASLATSELEKVARRGDRYAQLELGKRLEAGNDIAKDLKRAEKLYYKAATSPGAIIPTVISTPGGQSASITDYQRADDRFDGLKEAAMRWARLSNLRAQQTAQPEVVKAQIGESPKTATQQPQFDLYEPDMRAEAQSELIRIYGYQPVFNNLKYTNKPWQETIIVGGGARLINDEMVMHSFLYALDPPDETKVGETISAERIEEFCRTFLASANFDSVADRRMTGLCALHRCALVDGADWQKMAEGLAGPSLTPSGYELDAAAAFLDASFLWRVASRCSAVAKQQEWSDAVASNYSVFENAQLRCEQTNCTSDERYALRVARAGIANILFWAYENAQLDVPLVRSAATYWVVPSSVDVHGDVRDARVAENCATLGIEYDRCRMDYPYGYFLDARVLAFVKMRLSHSEEKRAQLLQDFRQRFAFEWRARS